ncbi:hypothetical protein [Peribacillus sp. SCS-37]|uniref:hypothetical protein n=1 Tax=Paraperibacillus esterisolvens TaxID=3115296 RepID=UPI003906A727
MNSLQDALYNWLTIKVVCDARPEDTAAFETKEMFEGLLTEEHALGSLKVRKDGSMYYVDFVKDGSADIRRFPAELIEAMLHQINLEPQKYRNFT